MPYQAVKDVGSKESQRKNEKRRKKEFLEHFCNLGGGERAWHKNWGPKLFGPSPKISLTPKQGQQDRDFIGTPCSRLLV